MIPRFSRIADPELLQYLYQPASSPVSGLYFDAGRQGLTALCSCLERKYIVVPAFICTAVVAAVVAAGKIPVLIDVTADLALNPVQLKQLIHRYPVAAVVVPHYYGVLQNLAPIREIVGRDICIFEDAAHVAPTGHQVLGDAAVYSFNFDKPVSLGYGGQVVTNNSKLTERMQLAYDNYPLYKADQRRLRGLFYQTRLMDAGKYLREYSFDEGQAYSLCPVPQVYKLVRRLGFSALPKTMPERMGLYRLGYLPRAIQRYTAALPQLQKVTATYQKKIPGFGFSKYSVRVADARKTAKTALAAGIEIGPYNWPRAIQQTEFGKSCVCAVDLAESEKLAATLIQLPTYPHLNPDTQDRIIALVRESL